jgi:hypothetical protein
VLEPRSHGAEGDVRLRALRRALAAGPEHLRVVAEDLLGAETRIDWVCAGPDGETWVVLQAEAGRDLELVARGLAQRAWVEARLADWLQLAPELGLRPEAGVHALLLCPAFGSEARAAAAAVAAPGPIRLATCHFEREGAELRAWIAPVEHPAARPAQVPSGPAPQAEFRTGLSDADLGVSAEEKSALEHVDPEVPTPREVRTSFRSD